MPEDKLEVVHPNAEGFVERVTPKKSDEDIFFFECVCDGSHYRHAGYMQTMDPFMRAGGEKRISLTSRQVMVCVSCKRSYIWVNEQMYEVTDRIDVKAWEKVERELQEATGPGGEC